MKKFTFKTDKPTGKYRAFSNSITYIKLSGKNVGNIGEDINASTFYVRLMVIKKDLMEDGNKNCPWKWIQLKQRCNSIDEMKVWLNENIELIKKTYNLFLIEN